MTKMTKAALKVQGIAIERIVAIRESDADRALMEGLLDQTLRMYRSRPGVEEALDLGLAPYDDPASVEGAERVRVSGHRAVSYVRSGTLFILWGGSAAKQDEDGDNAFVSYLARMIAAFAPTELLVSTFSRLVRSQNVQGVMRAALVDARTRVVCGTQVIDLGTDHGRMMWDVQALVFSMERDQIERRMAPGWVFAASRGRWMHSDSAVPPGYELVKVGETTRLEVTSDPDELDRVRRMISILSSRATAREKLRRLDQIGMRGSRNARGGTEPIDYSDVSQPSSLVRTLHSYRGLYRTGALTVRRTVPKIDGVDEIAGVPVQFDADGGAYVEVVQHPGLPDGGWARDRIFDAWEAEAERTADLNAGGAARRVTKPLVGMGRYTDTERAREYALLSDGRDAYLVRSRPLDPNRRYDGWDARKRDTTIEAQFDARELHRSIAEGIRTALQTGAQLHLVDAEVAVFDDGTAEVIFVDEATRRAHLEARRKTLRSRIERVTSMAADAQSDFLAEHYHKQAKEAAADIEEIERNLRAEVVKPAVPDTLEVHGKTLMDALKTLADMGPATRREHAEAVRTILGNLEWDLDDEDTAVWRVDVHLPTTHGLAILRGVTGRLPRYCRQPIYRAQKQRQSGQRRILELIAAGVDNDTIIEETAQHGYRASVPRLTHTLREAGLSAPSQRLVHTHPLRVVRQIIVADHLGTPLPDGWDRRWLTLARQAVAAWPDKPVINPQAWANAAQRDIDALTRTARHMTPAELAEASGVSSPSTVSRRLGYRIRRDGVLERIDAPALVHAEGQRLIARDCPNCDAGADWLVVNLPEFRGVLCRHCLRSCNGTAFHEDYRDWATRPLGAYLRLAERDVSAKLAAAPRDPFTLKEWADAASLTPGALQAPLEQAVKDGLIEEIGPDPRHTGPGMVPRLYRRVSPDRQQVAEAATAGTAGA